MKKRKFLSLFAILFVAIFALSVCFFAACKNKDEEEEPTPDTEVEDENDKNDGNDDDETDTGRQGSSLTGDEDIIGSWSGDVEIRAELMGYGGTIEAVMNAEITQVDFSLSFTPTEITLDDAVLNMGDSIVSLVNSMLSGAGIAVGTEFPIFENVSVLKDDAGCFADIDGDYVTCQLPLDVDADGKLVISFSETMTFSSFPIDISFDAVLDAGKLVVVPREDYVIDVATASDSENYLTVTLEDGTTAVTFVNNAYDMDITTSNGTDYIVNGTSSEMTADMAEWFGGSEYANEGDQYVVIKIKVAEEETISYSSNGGTESKSYTNSNGDTHFDDGYYFVVYKLTFDEYGVCTSRGEYTITDANGNDTVYTVSFSGVTVLTRSVDITVDGEVVTSLTMEVGDTLTFTGAVTMSDGSSYGTFTGCSWASTNENVATATQERLFARNAAVKAVGEGETKVTITLATGEVGTCIVTVVDPLVSIYEGDGVTLGDGTTTETFANEYGLTVAMAVGENGSDDDYTVTGASTMMTDEQIAAYNAVYGTDAATGGDAFVVIEIKAAAGNTVSYDGKEYTVEDGATSVAIVQKISDSATSFVQSVTIASDGETVAEFTITFESIVIPTDDAILGTWSNNISASASALGTDYECTADIELTFNIDRTFTLTISNIDGDFGTLVSNVVSSLEIPLTGTWSENDGTYTLHFDNYGDASFTLEEEATEIQLSFSISYDIVIATIDIEVTNQSLIPGSLEDNAEVNPE